MFPFLCAAASAGIVFYAWRHVGLWSLAGFALTLTFAGFFVRGYVLVARHDNVLFNALPVDNNAIASLLWQALIGLLAILAGMIASHVAMRMRIGRPFTCSASRPRQRYSSARLLCCGLLVLVVQAWLLARVFGGASAALSELSRRSFTGESFGMAANLSFVSVPLLVMAVICARRERSTSILWLGIGAFMASIPVLAIVNGRGMVVTSVFALALMVQIDSGARLRMRWLLVGVAVAVLTAVVGLSWRQASQEADSSFASALAENRGQALYVASDSLPLLDGLDVGHAYVSRAGHDEGRSLLDAFAAPVPRSAWPDKPEFMPQRIAQTVLGSNLSGLPVGLLGEGWIAGGWAGIVCYCFGFGAVVYALGRRIRGLALRTPTNAAFVFVAVNVVMESLRTGAQGGLITVVVASVMWVAIGLPIQLVTRRADAPSDSTNRESTRRIRTPRVAA